MKRFAEPFVPQTTLNSATPWQAWLALGLVDDAGATRLVERSHYGPLRVQKPLYPEGSKVCHAIIVHPPGGVVGGDELSIHACVGDDAAALVTTPGAAKWYRAGGRISRQSVHLNVGENASLEWLPQESIFFDDAHVRLDNHVELAGDASYIGCEILCFGRTASGESFTSGRIEQRTSIRREGRMVWFEQGMLDAGSDAVASPLGLNAKTVCATLIVVGKTVSAAVIKELRETCGEAVGITQMKSVLVARHLGDSSEAAKQLMTMVWQRLRPAVTGREAVVPRIWQT
ncbi:urease accessory protein UreD [Noviherbaspirillum sp.]|uniref:urease accessory protein UreD n=1 Tax=Noviherbaspirillum sp. TaxID=1926288 RepID=UPI002FE0A6F8